MVDRTLRPQHEIEILSSPAKTAAITVMSLVIALAAMTDVFAAKPTKTPRTIPTVTTTTSTTPTETTTTTVTSDTTTTTTSDTTTTTPTTTTSDTTTTTTTTSAATTDTVYDNRVGLGSDLNGIPILEKHPNARYIYWNPTLANASDSNPGTDPNFPKLTPAGAWNALRNGYGDWLLMAQGNTWPNGFGVLSDRNGLSSQYPIVVTTYDPADPANTTKMRQGLVTLGTAATQILLQTNGAQFARNVVFENIQFDNASHAKAAITVLEYGSGVVPINWLFHNVRFKATQVVVQGTGATSADLMDAVVFRHCSFAYAWAPTTDHAQGIYLEKTTNITIEDSIFYHNGWQSSRDEAYGADVFKHNLYLQANAYNTMFRRNVSGWASSHGIQMRGGGTIEDSVFGSNPINILMGGGTSYMTINPTGISGIVRNNVIVGSSDINASNPRGYGIVFSNTQPTTMATDNIIANVVPSSGNTMSTTYNRSSLWMDPYPGDINTFPIYLTWNNNIEWNWNITTNGVNASLDNLVSTSVNYHLIRDYNVIHYSKNFGTNTQLPSVPFVDPNRDLGTYALANGYDTEKALWEAMIADPMAPWSNRIRTYIKAGFNM